MFQKVNWGLLPILRILHMILSIMSSSERYAFSIKYHFVKSALKEKKQKFMCKVWMADPHCNNSSTVACTTMPMWFKCNTLVEIPSFKRWKFRKLLLRGNHKNIRADWVVGWESVTPPVFAFAYNFGNIRSVLSSRSSPLQWVLTSRAWTSLL